MPDHADDTCPAEASRRLADDEVPRLSLSRLRWNGNCEPFRALIGREKAIALVVDTGPEYSQVAAKGTAGPYVMNYYTRDDIPFQFALAENFTICDHYFCSVLGPTWPNRLMHISAWIDPRIRLT